MFQLIIILKNKCSVLEIITTNESDEFNIAISFIFKFVLYIYQYRKNILYNRDVKEYFSKNKKNHCQKMCKRQMSSALQVDCLL